VSPILGVDFGKVRIGLAISDELRWLAHPLETVTAASDAVKRIARIVRERRIDTVVVGIPKKMSGEIGKSASEALAFVKKLRAALACEIVTWDERLTTTAAQRALRQAGKKVRATRQVVDQVAAQMILQSYLDRQHNAVPAEEISG
jgi:putative Holliday junction resolvase